MNRFLAIAVLLSASTFVSIAIAQSAATDASPATQQTTPAAQAPATMPDLSPDVVAELDKIRAGYAAVKTLRCSGTFSGDLDIDGRAQTQSANFSDSFALPNLFRHDTENQIAYGSTGSGAFAYYPDRKNYVTWPMPDGRSAIDNLPADLSKLLRQTDMGLLLAISPDPALELVRGADKVSKAPDVTIDNAACPALAISVDNADVTAVMDPQTHLLRRLMVDMTRAAKQQGAQQVKTALFTFDYATIKLNADTAASAFAWTPPAGASPLQVAVDPTSLAGKPMPAFKCVSLDGKPFSSDQLKGSVTILDFWAVFCGPCKIELPHLDAIYQANKSAGLQAYAIDETEPADTVTQFVSDSKLGIPVLLDSDGTVGKLFGADQAIPVTVVIGKDGRIIHAYVGAGQEGQIAADVASALKAQ